MKGRGDIMSLFGRMECPGCSKLSAIAYMDEDGNPIRLHEHRDQYGEECPVDVAGDLLTWHYQRMKDRIMEAGTYTSPPRLKTQRHPIYDSSDPTSWLASLGE